MARTVVLALLLASCDSIGAVSCDEWCDSVTARAQDCAAEQGLTLEEYAGAARPQLIESCDAEVEASGRTESQCRLETGTVNNLGCDQILELVAEFAP